MNIASIKNRAKSLILDYKNRINFAHRLDYDKSELYLCDNIRLGACRKEPETVKWIESFSNDDVVMDVGANIGAYSLIMSVCCQHVYAVEPAFMNFYLLNKNIEYNIQRRHIQSNITPLNIALTDKTGIQSFHYINTHLGKAGNQLGATIDGYGTPFQPGYSQNMLSYSIDDLCEIFSLMPINHIKMDVDGIEFKILKGAKKTLGSKAMKTVLIEMDTENHDEVRDMTDYMASFGFRIESKTLIDSSRFFNFIFAR